MLNRNPIYYQLSEKLKELIASDEFQEGDKFLTERTIADRFKVSRTTANKVIAGLVSEGLLEIKKGVGTFTKHPPLSTNLYNLISFTAKTEALGLKARTRVIEFKKMSAEMALSEVIKAYTLPENYTSYKTIRLRSADDAPAILEERYLFLESKHQLTKRKLQGSLYALLRSEFGIAVFRVEQKIRAVALNSKQAELFSLQEGFPALEIEATACDKQNIPVWYERTLYRGDMYTFNNIIDASKASANNGIIITRN